MSAPLAPRGSPGQLTYGQKIGIFAVVVVAAVGLFFSQNQYERTQLWVVGGSSLASGAVGLVAVLIYKLRKQLEASIKELNKKELELIIAREVQGELFPKEMPRPRSMELAAVCEPARGISGDYYDFIDLTENRTGIVVADVSGKGVPAAILMANLQALIRSHRPVDGALDQVCRILNAQLFQSTGLSRYATLFYGIWSGESKQLAYVNAGHPPAVWISGDQIKRLEAQSIPLGLFDDTDFCASRVGMSAGDLLVIFTDGLTDTTDESDERFGDERLIELLVANKDRPVAEIQRSVLEALAQWGNFGDATDDTTLVIAKVTE